MSAYADHLRRGASSAEEFPIPTRGNESKTRVRTAVEAIDAGEFPIPMRGNESASSTNRRDLEITYLVSDPHEG